MNMFALARNSCFLLLKVACSSLFPCLYSSIKHTFKNIKSRVSSFKGLSVALIDLGKKKML